MTERSMTATLKYALSSEKKLSVVARLIRGRQVSDALITLSFLPKRAAKILLKVVKSASANAKNNMNISPNSLYIKEVLVSAGPKIRRVRSVGRSRMHGYVKHRAFVKVMLDVNAGQPVEKATPTKAKATTEAPAKKAPTKTKTGTSNAPKSTSTTPTTNTSKVVTPTKVAAPKKVVSSPKPARKAAQRGA